MRKHVKGIKRLVVGLAIVGLTVIGLQQPVNNEHDALSVWNTIKLQIMVHQLYE